MKVSQKIEIVITIQLAQIWVISSIQSNKQCQERLELLPDITILNAGTNVQYLLHTAVFKFYLLKDKCYLCILHL